MNLTGQPEEFLRALDDLDEALNQVLELLAQMQKRARAPRASAEAGRPLREIVSTEQSPLLVQLLTQTTQLLHRYGNRVRTTEAQALHGEGLTINEIARLFGVRRQRVSSLLRTPKHAGATRVRERDNTLSPDSLSRGASPVPGQRGTVGPLTERNPVGDAVRGRTSGRPPAADAAARPILPGQFRLLGAGGPRGGPVGEVAQQRMGVR